MHQREGYFVDPACIKERGLAYLDDGEGIHVRDQSAGIGERYKGGAKCGYWREVPCVFSRPCLTWLNNALRRRAYLVDPAHTG